MRTFFTSDLHLGHERINQLARRPFASAQEADAELVRRWNWVVMPQDTVYVLGDIAMGQLDHSLEKVARLNGLKFLVPGNHDRVSSLYKGSESKKAEWRVAYRDAGLRVLEEKTWIMIGETPVELCHFPFTGDSQFEDRYADARPKDHGQWLLHGHVHSRVKRVGRQIHVGVDAHDYAPVSEETILQLMSDDSLS